MNVLLIGGPGDGRRLVVDDSLKVIRIAETMPAQVLTPETGVVSSAHIQDHEYRLGNGRFCGGEFFAVFMWSAETADPFMKLWDGYRGGK